MLAGLRELFYQSIPLKNYKDQQNRKAKNISQEIYRKRKEGLENEKKLKEEMMMVLIILFIVKISLKRNFMHVHYPFLFEIKYKFCKFSINI